MEFQGKRALVIGVSSGLGIGNARAIAARGGYVVGTAPDLAKACGATGGIEFS
jgi:NAD(P)-dependent dehydrogenase (short-subunit alcohol dehydrogenase family)